MPEPSLSADTRSMLHDEHSKRLDNLEQMHAKGGAHTAVYSRVTREERVRGIQHVEHSQRLEALEKKTNGLIQTRADHGHQFIVIIDRVKALEERVAALEEQLMSLDDDVAVLWSKNDEVEPREPLPKEDLD